jgi:ADP-ribose pyrophosphatase YjhB (NUDIX family)
LGASIAVFKGDAVLLVERGLAPRRGLWSLPGGSIEEGESPSDAALRELKEETGIEAEIEGLLDTVEFVASDADGRTVTWRLAMFYGRCVGGSLRSGSDAAKVGWFSLGDLEKLNLTPGTAALIRLAADRIRASSA